MSLRRGPFRWIAATATLALLLIQAAVAPPVARADSNLALNKPAAESGHTQVYAAANATDGNQGTYWEGTANAYPNWIRIDLGAPAAVNQVAIKLPGFWGTRTQTLSVLGSADDAVYQTLAGSAAHTFVQNDNTVTIPVSASNVRYVKLVFTDNSGATGGQASEIEVYGTASTTQQALSAFNSIAASSYSSQSGIQLENSSEGGQNVAFIDNGDSIAFASVDFGSGASTVQAHVASAAGGGAIEFRLDSPTGTPIAQATVPGTGGWQSWTTVSAPVSGASGIHPLYLVFKGGAGNLFNVNWFKFGAGGGNGGGGDVVGHVFAGYQGWFNAAGDGSPNGSWIHWSKNGGAPAATGNVNFEIYPDIREYSKLYQTSLANLGNGAQAKLFSSYDQETVDKHFEWMQTYGIDGAALQRFGASASDSPDNWRTNRDSVAAKVKNAAETYGRKFYVMYDITGMDASGWVAAVKHDWTTNVVNSLQLTSSSAYAQQDGKTVVCIWGIGFTDRPGTAAEAADLIGWFQNQGIYVIGGVPSHWRTGNDINDSKSGFLDVYKSLDMLSPWFVGRFSGTAGADDWSANDWQPDLAFAQQNGIAYQPVLWPGFSWKNLYNDRPINEIPRLHGDFMWRQAYDMKSLGIDTGYIAMFDEYDEGTAIAKAAENSSMIPTNQYFLTLDADGVAVSSDFYLRLAGDITRLFKGQIPLTVGHPTSHQ